MYLLKSDFKDLLTRRQVVYVYSDYDYKNLGEKLERHSTSVQRDGTADGFTL